VVDGEVSVLEANPRASRTVPFASKAIGVNLVEAACRLMTGARLAEIVLPRRRAGRPHRGPVSVKAAVLPFGRFPGSDPVLGPEMRSTGEVMGIDEDLGCAMGKAFMGASRTLPLEGQVFISVCDRDKPAAVELAKLFHGLGFKLLATSGTAKLFEQAGLPVRSIPKRGEGRPDVVDVISSNEVQLVINTPTSDPLTREDEKAIRTAALLRRVPTLTTVFGAKIIATAIESMRKHGVRVKAMQDFHAAMEKAAVR